MTLAGMRMRTVWAALTAMLVVVAGGGITLLPMAPAAAAPATTAVSSAAPAVADSSPTAPADAAPSPTAPAAAAPESAARAAGPVTLSCSPGVVYSVSSGGQLRKITNGASTKVGQPATKPGGGRDETSVTSFNGLGVGKNGSPIYAYERTDAATDVELYEFDPAQGTWASTGKKRQTVNTGFIGGAVDLKTGNYYFGGFKDSGKGFEVYLYDSQSGSITLKGTIDTRKDAGSTANGDIAFDSEGNLFVVRGSGTTTTVFSVTAANLAGAAGGAIAAAKSTGFKTNSDVNGVAFDADGKAYLGTGDKVTSYDMPNWSNQQSFASGSSWSSTDLATCSSPATITLQKDVQGDRAKPADQFELSLEQGRTELGNATTTGSATGVQDEIVGPIPAKRGTAITFSESAANGAELGDYASAYSCKVDGQAMSGASGQGTSGKVTIPNSGEAVVCTITNAPLTASVSIHKDVADEDGKNVEPGQNWTVGAEATATTDGVTATPSAATQKTNADGDAEWRLKFTKETGRATVAVSETQQDGFEFKEASCRITHLDGTKDTKTLRDESATGLTGIRPGDDVQCSYLNRISDTELTLVKKVDNEAAGAAAKATDWTLKAAGETGNTTIEGVTGSKDVTKAKVGTGRYALSESDGPAGYEASDWVCRPSAGTGLVTSDGDSVTLAAGDDVTCTITNTAQTGTVTWAKTDEGGSTLSGSVWTMTGPDGTEVVIADCTAASADECSGPDTDPAAGTFAVEGLKWGEYTLVEKSAPAGYLLDDTEHTFTVSGSDDELTQSIGSFENVQKPPVALPLTGGTGSQIFIIGGAALCAAGGVGALLKGLRRRNRKH